MSEKRVKLNQIVKNQLPSYVQEDFPLVGSFLSQYYQGQEYKGGPIDLIQNIDSYIKLSECGSLIKSTNTTAAAGISTSTIFVSNTTGFPDNYGLIKINDEIITYESKTDISFVNCKRGFSGITSFRNPSDPENLVFSTSTAQNHENDTVVENLSVLFLDEFLKKAKNQFLHGFQKDLNEKVNQSQFIRQAKDFYSTRGTDESFNILFGALYGEKVDIIRPIDDVISPSNANYLKSRDIVVEIINGDPDQLVNRTLYQNEFENISKAYAPVASVEKISVGIATEEYFKLSLDASQATGGSTNLIYGEFSNHAKTKIIGQVGIAQTFIDVDSTLGFPNSGTLSFLYENGTSGVCTYSDKTINQFLGINTTGIAAIISDNTAIDQNTFAYASDGSDDQGIRVKIRGVLNNFIIPPNVLLSLSQPISLSLGVKSIKSPDIQITPRYLPVILSFTIKNNWRPMFELFFIVDKKVLSVFHFSDKSPRLILPLNLFSESSVNSSTGSNFSKSSGDSGIHILFFTSITSFACSGFSNTDSSSPKTVLVFIVGYFL